jgi:two-component system cell cycle sensor histidine kinase/response regulator CckA
MECTDQGALTVKNLGAPLRKFGLEIVGDIPWGTHLCQFYETQGDLVDILVPYLAEGLKDNEFCMWVTSSPLDAGEARAALKKAVPNLDTYIERGQIEILSYRDWYLLSGEFEPGRVLQGWVEKERIALSKGFEGLRLTGNTFWVERGGWRNFTDYEATINDVIPSHRMIALCTYSLEKCSSSDIVDVIKNHVGTLIRKGDAWYLVEERRQVEEKLRAASLYARSLIEASLDPLVTISAEGKITDVNRATESATGFQRDQLIGSDFSDYFTEPEKAREGYQKVFTEGLVRDYPLAIRHKSGRIIDVLYNASVYRNEQGDIQGVFAAARDITRRRQAEIQIREQAELINKAHDAIIVRDLDDHVIFWNEGAQRLYGWASEEVMGKKIYDLFFKEEMIRDHEARKSIIWKGECNGEWRHRTKDGREIIVECRCTLMRDEEGRPKSILGINTDVTERKRLEMQILRAQRMESIGTLASGIAHDLNNILTPITLSLQLLGAKLNDEESRKTLDILENSTRRGADLVRQVMTFARGVEGERKPIQVKHIIAEIERIINETFPKSIEIREKISKDLWPISGDATQLHQVLMNLVLNGRDAMPDGGVLGITADNIYIDEDYARIHMDAKVGRYVVISVSDNGVGIPMEIRDKIFEPFFTTKERGKGTGLGLSTAQAIVKSHGGFITMYSDVGRGSTFKVYLPVTAEEVEKTEIGPSERVRGKGELILIVEDEASICDITRRILESNGYKVVIANDGAEGVSLYTKSEEKVAAVLMDMAMPIMDGAMSIRALRKIDPKVRIIAVSGLTENDKVGNVMALVNAFLAKPYTSDMLLKVIDEVLKANK